MTESGVNSFARALGKDCSDINETYLSNHTLCNLGLIISGHALGESSLFILSKIFFLTKEKQQHGKSFGATGNLTWVQGDARRNEVVGLV